MKAKTEFVCNQCGNVSGKWLGRCPECGAWNSYTEEIVAKILEHAQKLTALKGERIAIIEMRGHLGPYFRKLPYSKPFRPGLVSIKTYRELETLCCNYLNSLNSFKKN